MYIVFRIQIVLDVNFFYFFQWFVYELAISWWTKLRIIAFKNSKLNYFYNLRICIYIKHIHPIVHHEKNKRKPFPDVFCLIKFSKNVKVFNCFCVRLCGKMIFLVLSKLSMIYKSFYESTIYVIDLLFLSERKEPITRFLI